MTLLPEDMLKLFLAILVGGLIGVEREFRHKAVSYTHLTLPTILLV